MIPPGLLTESDYHRLALEWLAPGASVSLWDWCADHLVLRNGRFDPDRAGIMAHWYRIAGARLSGERLPGDPMAHLTEQIYLIAIAQLAKTTLLLAIAAYMMANHPRECALYLSQLKAHKKLYKRGLRPMIERTRPLADMLPDSQEAREAALGQEIIDLAGALLYQLSGNNIEDVRSLPLPLILADEFDRLMDDLDGEGDPVDLMLVRQRTMPHERLFVGSTTPSRTARHGWRRLCGGSHERPLVVCPVCGGLDFLNDQHIVARKGALPLREYPDLVIRREGLARWACQWCSAEHDSRAVRAMVLDCIKHSRWIAGTWSQNDEHPHGIWLPAPGTLDDAGRLKAIIPPDTVIRSGWANALYSRDETLDSFAATKTKNYYHGTSSQKRTWTNTEACRPWIHVFTPRKPKDLATTAGLNYALGSCPVQGIDMLIMVMDQQGNDEGRFWFPYVLRAWKRGVGSWLVDTGSAKNETEAEELEERLWPIGNQHLTADVIVRDVANPNYRRFGYRWAAGEPSRRLCLRGDVRMQPGETWREVPPPDPSKASRTSRPAEVHEWRIHPHAWRDELEERLSGRRGGWHIPTTAPDFYLKSLNAEDRIIENRRQVGGGFEDVAIWVPRVTQSTDESVTVRKDIHWADCEKMQLAMAEILNLNTAPDPSPIDTPAGATDDADDDLTETDDDRYLSKTW